MYVTKPGYKYMNWVDLAQDRIMARVMTSGNPNHTMV
jgi:hypothetical protein